ncbi:MAG: DUF4105 domain-containing protein [Hyphomonadaceae bacterium]
MQKIADWVVRHPWRAGLGVLLAVFALSMASCAATQPHTDRDWYPYLSRTTDAAVTPESFTVSPVIDWRYDASGPIEERFAAAQFSFADLRNVWFVLEPQPGMDAAAHTLLLFEFSDDRLIGVTIEARREADEEYSAWEGIWNKFELAYVWASARDLLTRRAVYLDHEVFVYPIDISEAQKGVLLQRLLARTEALETQPRFYNTLFSNCTNELAKATDLTWHYSFILTGYSDDHLYRDGLIPGASFEAAHTAADMTNFIKTLNTGVAPEAFDAALLAELRRRLAG